MSNGHNSGKPKGKHCVEVMVPKFRNARNYQAFIDEVHRVCETADLSDEYMEILACVIWYQRSMSGRGYAADWDKLARDDSRPYCEWSNALYEMPVLPISLIHLQRIRYSSVRKYGELLGHDMSKIVC